MGTWSPGRMFFGNYTVAKYCLWMGVLWPFICWVWLTTKLLLEASGSLPQCRIWNQLKDSYVAWYCWVIMSWRFVSLSLIKRPHRNRDVHSASCTSLRSWKPHGRPKKQAPHASAWVPHGVGLVRKTPSSTFSPWWRTKRLKKILRIVVLVFWSYVTLLFHNNQFGITNWYILLLLFFFLSFGFRPEEVSAMGMETCCTLGLLNAEQAKELKAAGLTAYNHNLDTSPEHYPNIVSTRHSVCLEDPVSSRSKSSNIQWNHKTVQRLHEKPAIEQHHGPWFLWQL